MSALLLLGMLGWPEIIMVFVVVLILFGAKKLPDLARGLGSGVEEFGKLGFFKRAVQSILDELGEDEKLRHHSDYSAEVKASGSARQSGAGAASWLVIWLAQGFGIGRIPWAPGTFGSLFGLCWFGVLLLIAQWSPVSALALFVGSIVASVWTCEAAEILLDEKDPGSIVLDEIVALPTCFLGWVFHLWLQLESLPSLDFFFGQSTWFLALGVFLAFRFFDIAKPWPVRQSQSLPRGWGVMADDQLAAVYVNLLVLAVHITLQALR